MKLYEPFQFLTAAECDDIIKYAKTKKINKGTTLRPSNARNNRVVWYEESILWEKWISMFNTIEPVVDWIQTPQIAFYKTGEEYKWHTDIWPNYRTHIRHFTLTCELQSAPDGRLELENKIFDLQKGEAIVFKPQDRHRAVSPTSGERISFTIWAMAKNPDKVD
jgi:hypothetical protein